MGIMGKSFSVKVVDKVVVSAEEPWTDHWLSFTNLDLLVPPFNVSSFFCYNKPSHGSFPTMLNTLKASLSQALALYPPVSGDIAWNGAAGKNQIHCNNQGVDFILAFADVELKELNFYNPDDSIEGKLMPEKQRGVCAIQVTELKCGGMVIAIKFDHRIVDGYSANMFISSWADMARSEAPSMIPSFTRSHMNPRSPPIYSSSIDDVFAVYSPQSHPDDDQNHDHGDNIAVNRIYYIKGEQLKRLQSLASESGRRRSKLVAFTSYLWKNLALSMEDAGNHNEVCNVAVAVDGRRRLSEGDGEQKEKLMDLHFGNVLSIPYGTKKSQELNEMSLSNVATDVHEFLQTATGKDHFLDLIDWVEEQGPQPLIAKAFASKDMSVMVSSGQRFHTMDEMDFGWGKLLFGSCHVPSERKDCFVMTMGSPTNNEDWVVYLHLPLKHMKFMEAHASDVFKPLDADYLKI
ncbi:shikimate O-hydroxycinnamoyltransferase-like [Cynara cardunculus var. scolymus]|uniref:Chloramphenicol acetyltransferase-like domain-containing protein n=1 Tax=Cynara cardunculus var. scolymus TaxID=59895 RepID=A0A103XVC2_CYNCS|nr:shikimate O-hydroxycinnamoyltransferase-like [Cynara cardunculus var. scolymus]KVH97486.1 Chloramphenicol acetyltransferase-like domain-containing protein [Cynara cardunculus var. scolymus]